MLCMCAAPLPPPPEPRLSCLSDPLPHSAGCLLCRAAQLGGGSGGGAAMQAAYLRSLTAKWLSCTRSDSPSTVLSLMQVGGWVGG